MKKKEENDGASAGAGGGGDWKTVGRAAAGGGGGPSWKPKAAMPKPTLNMDSEEQFPSLGSAKPRPTAEAAKKQGFAALAASWAHQDAEEAVVAKRLRDEAHAAAEQRAKEAAQYGILDTIMRRREETRYGGGGYSAETGAYPRSQSPAYPPYDEEEVAEAEEEEPQRGINYDEEEEGWATR
jgi:hypothetical protein